LAGNNLGNARPRKRCLDPCETPGRLREMPKQQDQGSCEKFSAMPASKPKRSLVSATTALKLKRRRDACTSTATRQHICKVGTFIAGRQVCCGKQVDHEGNFATNSVLAQGVNSPRTTDVTRTARSPRGQICRGRQIRQGRSFTLRQGLIRRETSPRTATLQRRVI